LVGVAVYVTEVPEQTGFEEAIIDTLTGRFVVTVIVIKFDVAGLPVAQDSDEVISTVITFPLDRVVVV
jgi:hypothetical protein